MGSVTRPVKDPLDRRHGCGYLQVQIRKGLNPQTSNYWRISLFLFNELLLLLQQIFFQFSRHFNP
jgi:hypothetical protein